jgi:acetyl-CoA C-acetyltransferase
MRDVAVVGVGMTEFGRHLKWGIKELGEEAVWKALKDAKMDPEEIQVAYCGNAVGGIVSGTQGSSPGQIILMQLGITGIPITRIEAACSSASCAFREAWIAVASGLYDVAIALGVEKMYIGTTEDRLKAMAAGSDAELESAMGVTFPGVFGMIARKHMHEYGTTPEQLAMVSVKNHKNGAKNPVCQYGACTLEEVLNSRMIADPLTLLECCPISDGAAAAILTTKELARKFTDEPIWVKASSQSSGTFADDLDITTFGLTKRAAKEAYEMAGLGPKDIDLTEVHDCFAIAEILHTEDLGFCKKGEGGKFVEEGRTEIDGDTPISTSGGLLSKGHPVGATGVAQIVEVVEQLTGQSGERQVKNAEIGMAHCMGGFFHGDGATVVVHILAR